jgi:teichuronic acid biosynthesis glycosyltransferase TuaG
MPVRNAVRFLAESTASVLGQSMSDLELLVVDDGSTDGSPALIERLVAGDSRVSLRHTAGGRGAAEARNLALANAGGRYIAFLDADDLWLDNKLERQLAFMHRQEAYFSYTAYEKTDAGGRRSNRRINVPPSLEHRLLLKGCPIGCSTVMIDTVRTGPVRMPLMYRSQDYACWLELVRRHGPAAGLNEVLSIYREHRGSLSANKFRKLKAAWRIYREQELLSWCHAAANLAAYATHGLRKRLI